MAHGQLLRLYIWSFLVSILAKIAPFLPSKNQISDLPSKMNEPCDNSNRYPACSGILCLFAPSVHPATLAGCSLLKSRPPAVPRCGTDCYTSVTFADASQVSALYKGGQVCPAFYIYRRRGTRIFGLALLPQARSEGQPPRPVIRADRPACSDAATSAPVRELARTRRHSRFVLLAYLCVLMAAAKIFQSRHRKWRGRLHASTTGGYRRPVQTGRRQKCLYGSG